MKLLSKRQPAYLLLLIITVLFSCKKSNTPPRTEEAKLTKLSLTLDGPKAKRDAVVFHEEAGGITNQTSGSTITISDFADYTGILALEETTGTTKKDATTAYTITYQITGVDATISAAGDKPTLTTRAAGTGTLKVTATKGTTSHSVTFPLTVTN